MNPVQMRLSVLLLLIRLIWEVFGEEPVGSEPKRVALRKCCPLHQRLDHLAGQLDCVDNPSVDDPQDLPFAPGALINASALEAANFSTAGVPRWMHAEMPIWEATATDNRSDRPLLDALGGWVQLGPAPPCPAAQRKFFTWDSKSRYRFLSDGRLRFRPDSSQEHTVILQPNEYCTDVVQNYPTFFVCPCEKTLCLNKCCQYSEEMTVNYIEKHASSNCKKLENKTLRWKPRIYFSNGSRANIDYTVLHNSILCGSEYSTTILYDEEDITYRNLTILSNGNAYMEGLGNNKSFPWDLWCGDMMQKGSESRVENALVCLKIVKRDLTMKGAVYGSMFAVGAVFLTLTLLVYALLPSLRQSAHAQALLCHVGALLAASVAFAASQLRANVGSYEECYVISFTVQYAMLAAFFWLNAVCIEVARTFRDMLPTNPHSVRERRKFLYYSLYAWGCPAIIISVTAIMEFTKGLPKHIIRPNIGKKTCWIHTRGALFLYFYGPMALLLSMNLVLYGFTLAHLVRARKDTERVHDSNKENSRGQSSIRSPLHNPKERLILHLKLFLLMGVTWVMECVSAAVGQSDAYWYVTDAINMLRGVFVFIILCWKPDVQRQVKARLQELCCQMQLRRDINSRGGATERSRGSSSASSSTEATRLTTFLNK